MKKIPGFVKVAIRFALPWISDWLVGRVLHSADSEVAAEAAAARVSVEQYRAMEMVKASKVSAYLTDLK